MRIERHPGGYILRDMLMQTGKGLFSGLFDENGNLLEATRTLDNGQTSRPVVAGSPQWERLESSGKGFATSSRDTDSILSDLSTRSQNRVHQN